MEHLTLFQKIAVSLIPVLFAITLHEMAHGWAAMRFGDLTAKMMGRVTLNPLKHIDPVGTLLIPIVLMVTVGVAFGYAKPVPITERNLRNPRRDMVWIALAGPAANLLMAIIWMLIGSLGYALLNSGWSGALFLVYSGVFGGIFNVLLMVLNLIPIPPLDGSRVVSSMLPGPMAWKYNKIEPFGFVIVAILIFSPFWDRVFMPVIGVVYDFLATITGFA
ncbi:MAG: site-2 protease family protein [Chromatiales bacterium]|nr:site-2 protease family protein [Chromatiales bacterium]